MTKSIFFAGSGASVPFGVPTTAQMTQSFEAKLSKEPSSEYKLYDELKYRLRDYPIYDLEAMITIIQDIIDIQEVPKKVFSHPSVVYFSTNRQQSVAVDQSPHRRCLHHDHPELRPV